MVSSPPASFVFFLYKSIKGIYGSSKVSMFLLSSDFEGFFLVDNIQMESWLFGFEYFLNGRGCATEDVP